MIVNRFDRSGSSEPGLWRNWGRSEQIRPQVVVAPNTITEVREAVRAAKSAGLTVKAVGAGHSFTGIALAPGLQLELGKLTGVVAVDRERDRVTLLAGTRLYDLPKLLAPHGLAMPNLGDIDRQSISGATSTGTHGTGVKFGGISTQIVGASLVTADGELLVVDESQNSELLPAVALGLGALGILVEVTLQCVPAFVLDAKEQPEPLDQVMANLNARAHEVDHFEMFWFPGTDVAMTKTNTRLPRNTQTHPLKPVRKWVDESLIGNGVHQVISSLGAGVPAIVPLVNRTATKVWGNREFSDVSTRVFTTKRTVRFREMEYAVPTESLAEAFNDLRELLVSHRGDPAWNISFPIEVRWAAADNLWLSTASGRASGYIAVHRYFKEDPTDYFEAVEDIMSKYQGRPHWGKMHNLDSATLRKRYPRFDDFVALRDRLDPDRLFANPYLDRVLGD